MPQGHERTYVLTCDGRGAVSMPRRCRCDGRGLRRSIGGVEELRRVQPLPVGLGQSSGHTLCQHSCHRSRSSHGGSSNGSSSGGSTTFINMKSRLQLKTKSNTKAAAEITTKKQPSQMQAHNKHMRKEAYKEMQKPQHYNRKNMCNCSR